MIQLRKARHGDTESVLQILTRSRQQFLPYAQSPHTTDESRQWVADLLIPNYDVTIASFDCADAGVIATSFDDGEAWVNQLYIAPGFVRRGIGSLLLGNALVTLPRPVRLWTFQQNTPAISFYTRFGFYAIKYTDGSANEERCPDVLFELS